jgi:beta-glucosidase
VKRLFRQRFELGMWDPANVQPYKQIPPSVVDSKEHSELALRVRILSTKIRDWMFIL